MLTFHLHKIAVLHQFFDLFLGQPQHVARRLLELLLFLGVEVRPVAFRETLGENRAVSLTEEDDRSIPTRLASSRPRDALFEHTAAEIGIHQAFFGAGNRVHQRLVPDPFLSSKPIKPSRFEDSRIGRWPFHTNLLYSTRYYGSRTESRNALGMMRLYRTPAAAATCSIVQPRQCYQFLMGLQASRWDALR